MSSVPSSLALFSTDEIPQVWNHVHDYIISGISRGPGDWNVRDVYAALLSGQAQLWSSIRGTEFEGALVTLVVDYPQTKALLYLTIGGKDMDHWWQYRTEIEDYAKRIGCNFVEAWVRPGWVKLLAKDGWKETTRVIRKVL